MPLVADSYRIYVDMFRELLSYLWNNICEGGVGLDCEAKLAVPAHKSEDHNANFGLDRKLKGSE